MRSAQKSLFQYFKSTSLKDFSIFICSSCALTWNYVHLQRTDTNSPINVGSGHINAGLEILTNRVAKAANSFGFVTKKFMLVIKLQQVHFVNKRPHFFSWYVN